MRLLTKTTIYFLAVMMCLIVLSALYLFHQFSRGLDERSDNELIAEEIQWIQYLESSGANGTTFILKTGEVSILPVNAPVTPYPAISNVRGDNFQKRSDISYRELIQVVPVQGIVYQITIRRSQEQKTALISSFTQIIVLVFAVLLLAAIIFNWLISRRLWTPFQRSLQKIRTAELGKMKSTRFEETNTTEFNELNGALNFMTDKIYRDYINMKEFTENAAHEMQTPIAVIQSKLELLLQDTNLTAEQTRSVVQATESLTRLAKLNEGLLFLAKIENNQYKPEHPVNLAATCGKYLSLFNEIINDKELQVEDHLEQSFEVLIHPLLADSLVANLIGNAVKYNYPGGIIKIFVTKDKLEISNTSTLPAIDEDKLFLRFGITREKAENSNGLGLAIVKKIADVNHLEVDYSFKNDRHTFTVSKRQVK
jgi:signal transduction histidine kinase